LSKKNKFKAQSQMLAPVEDAANHKDVGATKEKVVLQQVYHEEIKETYSFRRIIEPGTIKTVVVSGNIFNVDTQDIKINFMISQGYEYLHSVPLSSMEMAVRFRKL
jgi:hypothetical protein